MRGDQVSRSFLSILTRFEVGRNLGIVVKMQIKIKIQKTFYKKTFSDVMEQLDVTPEIPQRSNMNEIRLF